MSEPTYIIQEPSFRNQQITIINNSSGSTPGYFQSPKDSGCNYFVNALDSFGDNIYVGGYFGSPENSIMGININNNIHFPLAKGLEHGVNAVYYDTFSNRLYAGGSFTTDGYGTLMYNISYFNFSLDNWIQMGLNNGQMPGLDNQVFAITSLGTNEYIGGIFGKDNNGIRLNYITRYNAINDTFNPLISVPYGVNNTVYAIAYDGVQYYYVGGNFQNAGGQQANSIARYDTINNTWEPLFDTITNRNGVEGVVYTILYDSVNSRVYVGGSFFKVSGNNFYNIAYWDITTSRWFGIGTFSPSGVENGTNGSVFTIIKDNANNLFIGGKFDYTDYNRNIGIRMFRILRNTQSISNFYNLAKWDGSNWGFIGTSNTQNGTNDAVHSLFYDINSNRLYVGGDFTRVDYSLSGSTLANYIAYWDFNTWNLVGNNGTNSSVNAITGDNNNIFIGGKFTLVDYTGTSGTSANNIVIWNQNLSQWQFLSEGAGDDNGLNGNVNCLYYENDILYIGGLFTIAHLNTAIQPITKGFYYNSVKWNVSLETWDYIGVNQEINGVNGQVFSIFYDNPTNHTYIAGTFNLAGYDGVNGFNRVNNITYFDGGAKWSQLEYNRYQVGLDNYVFALTVIGNDIYVGGRFRHTGVDFSKSYNICNNIARWNTINEAWYPLICDSSIVGEIGLSEEVWALATNGILLFVGGNFTYNGGITESSQGSIQLNYIAIWDPTSETWTQIISLIDIGLDASVLGLNCRFPYKTLYISGNFQKTNGGAVDLGHIAMFDLNNIGTTNGFQQIVGPGPNYNYGTNARTNTILDVYPRVYFGGEFYNVYAGDIPMNYLGYYLYIYISPEVTLTIEDLNFRQFLDTQTGIISQTYTLTNRFKSVILINYQEDSLTPLKYWLIMYRS